MLLPLSERMKQVIAAEKAAKAPLAERMREVIAREKAAREKAAKEAAKKPPPTYETEPEIVRAEIAAKEAAKKKVKKAPPKKPPPTYETAPEIVAAEKAAEAAAEAAAKAAREAAKKPPPPPPTKATKIEVAKALQKELGMEGKPLKPWLEAVEAGKGEEFKKAVEKGVEAKAPKPILKAVVEVLTTIPPGLVKEVAETGRMPPGASKVLREAVSILLKEYGALEGKAQFNKAIELGFVPKESVYVPRPAGVDERGNRIPEGWTYIPSDVAAAIKSETPDLYDVLTKKGHDAYQIALGKKQEGYTEALRTYEEWQRKIKSGEIIKVGGGEYMLGSDYANLPSQWKQYVHKYGVTALAKRVDSIIEKFESYKKGGTPYTPEAPQAVTYDVIQAIRDGAVTVGEAKELFEDLNEIEKRTKLASYTQLTKDFSALTLDEQDRVMSSTGMAGPYYVHGEETMRREYGDKKYEEILEMYATTYGIDQKIGAGAKAYPTVGKWLGQAYLHPKIAWKPPTEAEEGKGIVGMPSEAKIIAVALPVMMVAAPFTGGGTAGIAAKVAYYGASGALSGSIGYGTVKNWKDLSPNQKILGIVFTALAATPILIGVTKPSFTRTTPIKTSRGDIVIWRGFTLRGHPVIGVSFKHPTILKFGVQYPNWVAQEVTPGWVPGVKGVDANLLATKTALARMGFPQAEISKIISTYQLTKLMTSWLRFIPKPKAEALLQSIKSLDEKELELVLKAIAKAGKSVDKVYGSYSMRAVLGEALHREVADLDIMLLKDPAWTKSWVQTLVKALNRLKPGKFRISSGRATLIEALGADGKWHHALDIHYQGEVVPYKAFVTEGAYGMKFARNPITVNVPGVGKLRLMALKESVVRKMASILEWRGKGKVGPLAYRYKDITDFYDLARFVLGENYAKAWAIKSGLDPAKLAALADKNPAVVTWVIDMSPSPGTIPMVNLSPPAISAMALKELGISPGVSPAISYPIVSPPLQLLSPTISPALIESSVSLSISQMAPKLSPSVSSAVSKAIIKAISPLVYAGASPPPN